MTFIKPFLFLGLIAFLLLLEPDFGASTVILATALGMLFLSGVRLRYFLSFLALCIGIMAVIAFSAPYRVHRLTTFLNPWAEAFSNGYQLTQSLIAFGHGGFFGVGLGDSVQKLFYLPEAHTDFLFAVLAEELGLVTAYLTLCIFALLIYRGFVIAKRAINQQAHFAGMLGYGISLWLALQVLINVGVTLGALPTKGLTLPFMSYGGSSIMANCMAIGLLLRVDYETKAPYFSSDHWKQQWLKHR